MRTGKREGSGVKADVESSFGISYQSNKVRERDVLYQVNVA